MPVWLTSWINRCDIFWLHGVKRSDARIKIDAFWNQSIFKETGFLQRDFENELKPVVIEK